MEYMQTLTIFAADLGIAVELFLNALLGVMIFAVLFLPLLIIPYVFIKLGSFAGRVQGFLNNTAKGKGMLGKAAYGAGGRAWQNKSAQWAGRQDGSLRSKVGGFKSQRDYKHRRNKAEADRAQEGAIMDRALRDPRYARSAAGPGGQPGIDRVRAAAVAAEAKIAREDADNRISLLAHEAQSRGVSVKTHVNDMLNGNVAATEDSLRAAGDWAAGDGEAAIVEDMRGRVDVNQTHLNETILRNADKLKAKGGYHVQADLGLARGSAGHEGETDAQWTLRMDEARLMSLNGSATTDIAGMKSGIAKALAESLTDPTRRPAALAVYASLKPEDKRNVELTLKTVLENPNERAKNTDKLGELRTIAQALNVPFTEP